MHLLAIIRAQDNMKKIPANILCILKQLGFH